MSRIETLREQIKLVKSMSQSARHYQPIVIVAGDMPILVRNNDGSYARNGRGHLMLDQMAMHKQPVAVNHSLGDLLRNDQGFTDYLERLADLTFVDHQIRPIKMDWKRSPWELAKWYGIMWGGRTNAAATEYALRQEIQKTIPKARPYLVELPYRSVSSKDISAGRLCKEIMWVHGALYGLTPKERKLQEIIDDRFHVDPVRLSTSLTSTYAQLPIDSRFAMSLETYAWASRFVERPVHNSTGHWD